MTRVMQTFTGLPWKYPEVRGFRPNHGFTLMEVMIGVFLSTILMTGIVQLLSGSVSAYRLQLSQSQLEESGRYARDVLITNISQAGYQPEPWRHSSEFPALTGESIDGKKTPGDQLGLQRWSDHNCYGNKNPIQDGEGLAEFYLLQTRFLVNATGNLALTCRYGPDASSLKTQIRNYGLIENVESMQALFAEDRNGDDITDRWVTARGWQNESNIKAVKIALLLSTRHAFSYAVSEQISLLDQSITTPADGHLRRKTSLTTPIRGRLK
jgi:prepilin-type N-terminal cleavage/methylation domain-containing protein